MKGKNYLKGYKIEFLRIIFIMLLFYRVLVIVNKVRIEGVYKF